MHVGYIKAGKVTAVCQHFSCPLSGLGAPTPSYPTPQHTTLPPSQLFVGVKDWRRIHHSHVAVKVTAHSFVSSLGQLCLTRTLRAREPFSQPASLPDRIITGT